MCAPTIPRFVVSAKKKILVFVCVSSRSEILSDVTHLRAIFLLPI